MVWDPINLKKKLILLTCLTCSGGCHPGLEQQLQEESKHSDHPYGCKMAVASPGTASAFQLGRRGSKKRERKKEKKKKVCVPVCLLLSGRQQFPGSPTSFTLVDTSLATIGDLVISSNLEFWERVF